MYIESVNIESFGILSGNTFSFGSGINIIEGANESGKTTLGAFIKFIFYGFADKNERMLHIPHNADFAAGTCMVKGEGHYRIERSCTASGIERIKVVDLDTGLPCFKGQAPGEVFFGVPADIFERTAYVKQADNGTIDGRGMDEAIENLLYSADETVNTQKALKKIDDFRVSLLHKNQKGGLIHECIVEREQLQLKLDKAVSFNSDVLAKESGVEELKGKLENAKLRASELSSKIEAYETSVMLKKYSNLNMIKNHAIEASKALRDFMAAGTHNSFMPDISYRESLKHVKSCLSKADDDIEAADREYEKSAASVPRYPDILKMSDNYGGAEQVYNYLSTYKLKGRIFGAFGIIFLLLAALAGILTFLMTLFSTNAGKFVTVGCIVLVFGAFVCFMCKAKQKQHTTDFLHEFNASKESELREKFRIAESELIEYKTRSGEIELAKRNLERLTEIRSKILADADILLKKWNCRDIDSAIIKTDEFLKDLEIKKHEYERAKAAYESLSLQFEGLELSESELKDRFSHISGSISDEELEKADIKALRRDYGLAVKMSESLAERCHELEKQLSGMRAVSESPSEITDKITELNGKIDRMTVQHKAALLAYSLLSDASQEVRSGISPKLSEYAGRLMKAATGGKYTSLGIGAQLELEYGSDEHTWGSEFMSAGTLDTAYICVRYSLINVLFKKEGPIVIFDESFARMDDIRMSNIFRIISLGEAQTLIFTCQKRESEIMKKIGKYTLINI